MLQEITLNYFCTRYVHFTEVWTYSVSGRIRLRVYLKNLVICIVLQLSLRIIENNLCRSLNLMKCRRIFAKNHPTLYRTLTYKSSCTGPVE